MTTTVLVIFYHHWYQEGGGGEGGRGRRVLKKVLYVEALPRGPTAYPFIIIISFLAKMVLLSYTFFRQMVPLL